MTTSVELGLSFTKKKKKHPNNIAITHMEQRVNANFWLSIYKKELLLYSQTSSTESYPYQET